MFVTTLLLWGKYLWIQARRGRLRKDGVTFAKIPNARLNEIGLDHKWNVFHLSVFYSWIYLFTWEGLSASMWHLKSIWLPCLMYPTSKPSLRVPKVAQFTTGCKQWPQFVRFHSMGYEKDFSPGWGDKVEANPRMYLVFNLSGSLKQLKSFPHSEKKVWSQLDP